ncbi:MAG: glycoside hydrolase family 97 protein [Prevotella sp.]|jgi:alpha-glucosidase|nr:glycoside hydrolase family 97 protein [Prevotella sp.]
MIQKFYILIIFFLPGLPVLTAEKYLSIGKSTHVEWIRVKDGLALRSEVKGVEFLSEVGISISGKDYSFEGVLDAKQISDAGQTPVIYEFSSKQSPVALQAALFDNAAAFRYVSAIGQGLTVTAEMSSFSIPENCRVFYFERKNHWKLKSYAGTWESCQAAELPAVSGKNTVQGAPLLLQLADGRYALATEVNLQNYSGLRWDCAVPFQMRANFTEGKEGFELTTPLCTPWRVMMVAENLTELVNQTVVRELSPAPDPKLFADTDYIVPGKAVWRWFSRGTGNPEQERQFIDYAAELGFLYSVIDAGTNKWENVWNNLTELSRYARQKGVKLFLWNHSHNIADTAGDYAVMRHWLDSVKTAGISGVKIDFMDSESKRWIDFDIKLLQECAKRRLLVDFHGCQKPAGEACTYPNELTREGIRGLELNKLAERPVPSYHNALLPFTRFVVGHGDYTPLSFAHSGNTTFAHQLATLVAFNSPLQIVSEDPEVLLHEPLVRPALDLIKAVPAVWEQTIVLPQTELGKTAVAARRSGTDWYIYALNGTDKERGLTIDIADIAPDYKRLNATLYVDDLQAGKVKIEAAGHRPSALPQPPVTPLKKMTCKAEASCTVRLAAHGGAVIWLRE